MTGRWSESWRTVAAGVSAVTWLVGVAGELTDHSAVATVAFWVAVVVGGATFVPSSLQAWRHGRIGVGTLMTIAGVGALVLGQLAEAESLAFLFSVSEALEEWAISRAWRGLRAVLELVPTTTTVRRDGEVVEVDTDSVKAGDVIVLRAGARLVTDGVVRDGRSVLDVSAVTGESIPIECGPGDAIVAGSINGGEPERVVPVRRSNLRGPHLVRRLPGPRCRRRVGGSHDQRCPRLRPRRATLDQHLDGCS